VDVAPGVKNCRGTGSEGRKACSQFWETKSEQWGKSGKRRKKQGQKGKTRDFGEGRQGEEALEIEEEEI